MPTVSVIIPTFNRPELTQRALDSVCQQTFRDIEIFVVDDGSTDPSPILKAYVQTVGARWIEREHQGVAAARNAGVGLANSPWVAFLDSDDLWLPKKLEVQLAYLAAHPKLRLCQTQEHWIRNGSLVNPKLIHAMPDGEAFLASLERCVVSPSAVMIERELFLSSGGFDEALPACEDYDLWLRLAVHEPIGLVREKLIKKFGGHPDQLSRRYQAMDRFRVYALLKLAAHTKLSVLQSESLHSVLLTKLRILADGAKKRAQADAEFYQQAFDLLRPAPLATDLARVANEMLVELSNRGLLR